MTMINACSVVGWAHSLHSILSGPTGAMLLQCSSAFPGALACPESQAV